MSKGDAVVSQHSSVQVGEVKADGLRGNLGGKEVVYLDATRQNLNSSEQVAARAAKDAHTTTIEYFRERLSLSHFKKIVAKVPYLDKEQGKESVPKEERDLTKYKSKNAYMVATMRGALEDRDAHLPSNNPKFAQAERLAAQGDYDGSKALLKEVLTEAKPAACPGKLETATGKFTLEKNGTKHEIVLKNAVYDRRTATGDVFKINQNDVEIPFQDIRFEDGSKLNTKNIHFKDSIAKSDKDITLVLTNGSHFVVKDGILEEDGWKGLNAMRNTWTQHTNAHIKYLTDAMASATRATSTDVVGAFGHVKMHDQGLRNEQALLNRTFSVKDDIEVYSLKKNLNDLKRLDIVELTKKTQEMFTNGRFHKDLTRAGNSLARGLHNYTTEAIGDPALRVSRKTALEKVASNEDRRRHDDRPFVLKYEATINDQIAQNGVRIMAGDAVLIGQRNALDTDVGRLNASRVQLGDAAVVPTATAGGFANIQAFITQHETNVHEFQRIITDFKTNDRNNPIGSNHPLAAQRANFENLSNRVEHHYQEYRQFLKEHEEYMEHLHTKIADNTNKINAKNAEDGIIINEIAVLNNRILNQDPEACAKITQERDEIVNKLVLLHRQEVLLGRVAMQPAGGGGDMALTSQLKEIENQLGSTRQHDRARLQAEHDNLRAQLNNPGHPTRIAKGNAIARDLTNQMNTLQGRSNNLQAEVNTLTTENTELTNQQARDAIFRQDLVHYQDLLSDYGKHLNLYKRELFSQVVNANRPTQLNTYMTRLETFQTNLHTHLAVLETQFSRRRALNVNNTENRIEAFKAFARSNLGSLDRMLENRYLMQKMYDAVTSGAPISMEDIGAHVKQMREVPFRPLPVKHLPNLTPQQARDHQEAIESTKLENAAIRVQNQCVSNMKNLMDTYEKSGKTEAEQELVKLGVHDMMLQKELSEKNMRLATDALAPNVASDAERLRIISGIITKSDEHYGISTSTGLKSRELEINDQLKVVNDTVKDFSKMSISERVIAVELAASQSARLIIEKRLMELEKIGDSDAARRLMDGWPSEEKRHVEDFKKEFENEAKRWHDLMKMDKMDELLKKQFYRTLPLTIAQMVFQVANTPASDFSHNAASAYTSMFRNFVGR